MRRLNQDDKLLALHQSLRGMPSYKYLTKREQKLERAANAYLSKQRNGLKSQLAEIPKETENEEDEMLLAELRGKIKNVIAARGYEDTRNDFEAVLDRITELQVLQEELSQIDTILLALECYKPNLSKLLRLRYVEGESVEETIGLLGIVERTYKRWRKQAIEQYIILSA
ncbi:RNA polymerase subunit sigma-24 [Paenibacillus glycanilyticus]|uniref:ECF-type sigma factor n=1 Tax=Paenibacillus glycanilyticus TaxID=126569 RepID=UPI00203EFE06|nr:ECF-type sigma factor [Paenibacillus glycanilyticus]MCM3630508.1 RNA polymerase subunit sigma-24 [Paenibacillus glycanilyticus]